MLPDFVAAENTLRNKENQNISPFSVFPLGHQERADYEQAAEAGLSMYAFIQDGYYGSSPGWARINCDLLLEDVHKRTEKGFKDLSTVFL